MPPGFCELSADLVDSKDLRIPRARDLASRLQRAKLDYAKLVECRRLKSSEFVVFDVEVELPQVRKNPIERFERIAAEFYPSDSTHPEVLALRDDFPRVAHLNLRLQEFPKSLCLHNESWETVKRRWTSARFVSRVREWLSLTAKGELHQGDQPLEPLFFESRDRIVLPQELLLPDNHGSVDELHVRVLGNKESGFLLFADGKKPEDAKKHLMIAATVHRSPPLEHGTIYRSPQNLQDLAGLTLPLGLHLLDELRDTLRRWRDAASSGENSTGDLNFFSIAIIILFPKIRTRGSKPESTEVHAFLTGDDVKTVGIKLGLWEERDGHLAPLLGKPESARVAETSLDRLNISFDFDRAAAARLNGSPAPETSKIVAIGVGALGSQVFTNLTRSGFGTWTLVDPDVLLPHNLARHALDRTFLGFEKASTLSFLANSLLNDDKFSRAFSADIIHPGKNKDHISNTLKNAETILDMSADVTVARHLAIDVASPARRISLFLNPSGADLVLLAEDPSRTVQLDSLEMQYYRGIATDEQFEGHFPPPASPLRYGQSCRDATSTIPQDSVALHAALGARAVREVVAGRRPLIAVWRSDALGNVRRVDVAPSTTVSETVNGWTVRTDQEFLAKLASLRLSKLPNETGGVLLGSFDFDRRLVYLADTVPSPPDSTEWPTLYIRGCEGLRKKVVGYAKATDGLLDYAGEWHSHPGTSASPSADDHEVFSWIADTMNRDGLPPLMLIVAEKEVHCHVGRLGDPAVFSTSR